VYVVFDGFGNLVVPATFKAFPPTIHTLEYRPLRRPWHLLDPRRYALEHRKLLVVDGRVAFLGGQVPRIQNGPVTIPVVEEATDQGPHRVQATAAGPRLLEVTRQLVQLVAQQVTH